MVTAQQKIIIGAAGATGLAIFLVLASLGLVITSDGDKRCAGTDFDPCISYITVNNPSLNLISIKDNQSLDINFKLPGARRSDYTGLDRYELYVKFNRTWWRTNFTNATKLPGTPKSYVFQFRPLSKTYFKLVGYKNNPKDVIKWTFGTGGAVLDPRWDAGGGVYTYNYLSMDPNVSFATSSFSCSVFANFTNYSVSYVNGTIYQVAFGYFKNNVLQPDYSTIIQANTTPLMIYAGVNTTETLIKGDEWHCRARLASIENATNRSISPILISNYVVVENTVPSALVSYPANDSLIYISLNYPVTVTWASTEADPEDTEVFLFYGKKATDPDFVLLHNGTNSTYIWENASESGVDYRFYINVSDGESSNVSGVYNFSVSFINWSITYSPGIGAFIIQPNASVGTFYPINQSTDYGVFNATSNDISSLLLYVNITGGIPRFIDLCFNATNMPTCVPITKLLTQEPDRGYARFNDSTRVKSNVFSSPASNVTYKTEKLYKFKNFTDVTIRYVAIVNTTLLNTSEVKIYYNETLGYDLLMSAELTNSSAQNMTIANNQSATMCGSYTFNLFNVSNSTIIPCTGGYVIIRGTTVKIVNSTFQGSKLGSQGGSGGAGGSSIPLTGKGGHGGYTYLGGSAYEADGGDGAYAYYTSWHGYVGAGGGGGGAPFLGYYQCGGKGGNTGYYSGRAAGGSPGCAATQYDDNFTFNSIPRMGTGGGGGGGGGKVSSVSGSGGAGATGERGGSALRIDAYSLTLDNFRVYVNGGNGGAGGYCRGSASWDPGGGGGGQGGSGGEVIFVATGVINMTAYVESKGGTGGTYGSCDVTGNSGDVGQGGRIKILYVSPTYFNLTYNLGNAGHIYGEQTGTEYNGSAYVVTNSSVVSVEKIFNVTTIFNDFLNICTTLPNTHVCEMPIRMEGITLNVTVDNFNATQPGNSGQANDTYITFIPPRSTIYLWAKAAYNNSPVGMKFNFTWTVKK